MSCLDDHVMFSHILPIIEFQIIYLLHLIKSVARRAWHINSKMNQPPKHQEMGFFSLCMISRKNLSGITAFKKLKCPDPSMIPLAAEVKEWLQKSIWLMNNILILLIDLLFKRLILQTNMEICCSFKSFAGGTCGFSYREDRSCISQVVPLHSCKKDISSHFILFCRMPASSRRWFYNLPHT